MLRRHITCSAVVGALTCVALLTACSKGTPAGGTATVPTAAPTTADPWAVPATITPEYLNKVLAKLNQIDGDAFRDARAANSVTARYRLLEGAIRVGSSEVALRVKDVDANIASGFAGIKAIPGDRQMTVTTILPAPTPCVFAAVRVDFSEVAVRPIEYPPWYVALVPKPSDTVNPTHWALTDDGFEPGGGAPEARQACAAT